MRRDERRGEETRRDETRGEVRRRDRKGRDERGRDGTGRDETRREKRRWEGTRQIHTPLNTFQHHLPDTVCVRPMKQVIFHPKGEKNIKLYLV